ncbi:DUF3987 domain-containing protein [Cupriavidus metallidurans]|uniref:DUF3987 domain-containing protein n=1 Tax=Cupriavidus metallidurans TaxID=119219 RepID=UPI000CE05868|nr:DUF3987 domain-containing protein [Cupriavidus metallidurans]AVA36607.1 hypothetical protein C3Z06_25320 [Cupriavidus metallidurans]
MARLRSDAPGSPLEMVLHAFQAETDIPLELPFFAMLFYVSGYLLAQGVKVEFGGRLRSLETWTILLAPSGAGKSFTSSLIGRHAPVEAEFPECVSGAAFFQAMQDHEQKGKPKLWFQDEFAQKLALIETAGSPLAPAKEYLLRAYDGNPIEYTTKGRNGTPQVETVSDPRMAVLGVNTDEGFYKKISPESLVDGFAQRFAYVVAAKDPTRPMIDFPIYDEKKLDAAAEAAFARVQSVPLHPVYRIGAEGEAAFRKLFRELFDGDVPESFYRRAMFLAVKYAAIYHILQGKANDEIDANDFGWAARLLAMHLSDAKKMLAGACSDLSRMLARVIELDRDYAARGEELKAWVVATRVHGIKTSAEAKGLLALARGQ